MMLLVLEAVACTTCADCPPPPDYAALCAVNSRSVSRAACYYDASSTGHTAGYYEGHDSGYAAGLKECVDGGAGAQ